MHAVAGVELPGGRDTESFAAWLEASVRSFEPRCNSRRAWYERVLEYG